MKEEMTETLQIEKLMVCGWVVGKSTWIDPFSHSLFNQWQQRIFLNSLAIKFFQNSIKRNKIYFKKEKCLCN